MKRVLLFLTAVGACLFDIPAGILVAATVLGSVGGAWSTSFLPMLAITLGAFTFTVLWFACLTYNCCSGVRWSPQLQLEFRPE